MNTGKCIIGIPKNTRLRRVIAPVLERAFRLEGIDPGVSKSPFLENTDFVEMKISDLIRALRSRFLDLAIISDDIGLEERAAVENAFEYARNPAKAKMNLAAGNLERCFALRMEKAAELRTLVRSEERSELQGRLLGKTYGPVPLYEKAVTSYPELLQYYFRRRFGKKICGPDIWKVDGQVKSFLRNGVVPNLKYAYDLVGTGETAEKFGLVSVENENGDTGKSYSALPGFWKNAVLYEYQNDKLENIVPVIRCLLSEVADLDERNADEVMRI